jgi:hypothetical protein
VLPAEESAKHADNDRDHEAPLLVQFHVRIAYPPRRAPCNYPQNDVHHALPPILADAFRAFIFLSALQAVCALTNIAPGVVKVRYRTDRASPTRIIATLPEIGMSRRAETA